jgi:hypothetical protein
VVQIPLRLDELRIFASTSYEQQENARRQRVLYLFVLLLFAAW